MKKRLRNKGTRLEKLNALADVLAGSINDAKKEDDNKTLAQLAKQYRETINEIEVLEDAGNSGDEITELLSERYATGKSNTNS